MELCICISLAVRVRISKVRRDGEAGGPEDEDRRDVLFYKWIIKYNSDE